MSESRELTLAEWCAKLPSFHLVNEELRELREQVAHLSLYKPARRTEQKAEPVKRIGPTNFAFFGIVETDEEFAERAGTEVEE